MAEITVKKPARFDERENIYYVGYVALHTDLSI